MEDEFLVSYEAVTPGVPVLTRDKEQFGILEHVLEVPQLDLFDGIVVWVGGGAFADREIQKELSKGHQAAARGFEHASPSGGLRFVDADKIAAITAGYIRCDLDHSDVGLLPPPEGTPVYHVNMLRETGPALHDRIGRMFRRPHWTRE
ncbi:MAG TPA: hypothetical protein VF933_37865 [Streptosporangiaceae bacterium]